MEVRAADDFLVGVEGAGADLGAETGVAVGTTVGAAIGVVDVGAASVQDGTIAKLRPQKI